MQSLFQSSFIGRVLFPPRRRPTVCANSFSRKGRVRIPEPFDSLLPTCIPTYINAASSHSRMLLSLFSSELKPSYGTDANANATDASRKQLIPQQISVIYCVHGKLAQSCCELPDELNIRKIECKFVYSSLRMPKGCQKSTNPVRC